MTRDGPFGPGSVEAFYERQRRQILAALPQAGAARPRWRRALLAAAAAAVLVAAALVWQAGGPQAPSVTWNDMLASLEEDPQETVLAPYGIWDAEAEQPAAGTTPAVAAAADGPVGSLGWLLADPVPETAVPDYLAAFGAWGESTDGAEEQDSG